MLDLIVQLAAIAILAVAVVLWAVCFPNPSPLIRLFLKPKLRWPEDQIRRWLLVGRVNKSYLSFFNRDPERILPPRSGLVAPADGMITSAEVRNGIRYLVIALSFWDVHVQRSPADGQILAITASGDSYLDGEGRNFAFLREKLCPVQTRVELKSAKYGKIAVRLVTSLAARRIEIWLNTGDHVRRGQRLGRILLGSTVVLELDARLAARVRVGQRVIAGETLVTTDD